MNYKLLKQMSDNIIEALEISQDEEYARELAQLLGDFAKRHTKKLQREIADQKAQRN